MNDGVETGKTTGKLELVTSKPLYAYIIESRVMDFAIRALLMKFMKDLRVSGSTCVYGEAYDQIGKLPIQPDLVILDINIGQGISLEPIKQIHAMYPKVKILVYTNMNEGLYAERCLRAGAHGFVSKNDNIDYFIQQVHRILSEDGFAVSKAVANRLTSMALGRRNTISCRTEELLSDRELEVYQLIGTGMGTRRIAEKLNLSIKTIESHRAHIKEKLHLENAIDLLMHAINFVREGG